MNKPLRLARQREVTIGKGDRQCIARLQEQPDGTARTYWISRGQVHSTTYHASFEAGLETRPFKKDEPA